MGNLVSSSEFVDPELTEEQKLWKAVLSQAVYESCTNFYQGLPLTQTEKKESRKATRQGARKKIKEINAKKRTTKSVKRAAKRVVQGGKRKARIEKRIRGQEFKVTNKGSKKTKRLERLGNRLKVAKRKIAKNTPVTPYKRKKKLNGL